jgi:hypothetical protein
MIMNELISNVEMASLLSTGLPTILFKEHYALIVLIDDIVRHFDALGLQKKFGPQDHGHVVIDTNQFCFSRAPSVDTLFA